MTEFKIEKAVVRIHGTVEQSKLEKATKQFIKKAKRKERKEVNERIRS